MKSGARKHLLWAAVAVGLLLLVPFLNLSQYLVQVLVMALLYVGLGTAWNLVGGFTGQLSLGHAAFFGTGAYTLALLARPQVGLSPWLAILLGGIFALPLALVIGSICFRLRGPYFALSTIALAEVLRLVAVNWSDLTKGARGLTVPSLFAGTDKTPYYLVALAFAVGSAATAYFLTRSKVGYYLIAIREDEDTALAIGIDAARYKLVALLVSAFLTAVGGAFFASYIFYIEPDMVLTIDISIQMALVAIVGGLGTVVGPLVGAGVLGVLAEFFRTQFKEAHLLVYGLLLIAVILFMPGGIVGELRKLRRLGGRRLRGGKRNVLA